MHYSVWSEREEDEGCFIYREEEDWLDTSNDLIIPNDGFYDKTEENLNE